MHRADTLEWIIGARHNFSHFHFSVCCKYHSGWIASKINSCGPTHSEIVNVQILFSSSSTAERLFLVEPKQLQCISCPKKRWVVLPHSESMASSSSNSHNPLLWDQVSEHRPCAMETGGGGGGASLFLISIFHSVLLLFCLSLSLLPLTTKAC